MKQDAELNDRARVELALAQFREVLGELDFAEVKAAAQDMLDEGQTAAELAEELEAGLPLFLGDVVVH